MTRGDIKNHRQLTLSKGTSSSRCWAFKRSINDDYIFEITPIPRISNLLKKTGQYVGAIHRGREPVQKLAGYE